MTTSHAQGRALIFSNVPSFLGPKPIDDVRFVGQFGPAGANRDWTAPTAGFAPIVMPDVKTDHGKLTLRITLNEDARGSLDPATGRLRIDAIFLFETEGALIKLSPSTLEIKLDADKHTLRPNAVVVGQPVNEAGQCVLAGIGKFSGGLLGGFSWALQLEATFSPLP